AQGVGAPCPADVDTMLVFVTPSPTADAGADQRVCATNMLVNLSGSVTDATSRVWSTTGDGVFGGVNNLTTTYTPGAADSAAGTVSIVLTASRFTCNDASDTMIVTITPAPTANAGGDHTLCSNNGVATLNGSFT